jgi:hypothetical protein
MRPVRKGSIPENFSDGPQRPGRKVHTFVSSLTNAMHFNHAVSLKNAHFPKRSCSEEKVNLSPARRYQ